MSAPALRVLAALGGLLASGVLQVSGIKVFTAGEVEAVNGTDVWLKCTFESSEPVSKSSVTVSWTFRPLGQGQEESVFYYHQKPYLVPEGRFRKQVVWSGDIMAKDASITIRDVKFSYNGTFICQVKNLPEAHGLAGEVRLKVVASASYSEITILAAAIGGGILLMIIIILIVVAVKYRRKRHEEEELEFQHRSRKDPTMCHPTEAVYLCMPEKTKFDSDAVTLDASCKNLSLEEEKEKRSDDATDEMTLDSSSAIPSMKEEKEKHLDDRADGMISAETSENSTLENEKDSHFEDATDKMISTPLLEDETKEHCAADGMNSVETSKDLALEKEKDNHSDHTTEKNVSTSILEEETEKHFAADGIVSDFSSNNPSMVDVKEKHGGDTTNGIISDPSSKNPSEKEGKDKNSDHVAITKE